MNVIFDAAYPVTGATQVTRNGCQISMELGPDFLPQPWNSVLGGENQVHRDMGKGLGHKERFRDERTTDKGGNPPFSGKEALRIQVVGRAFSPSGSLLRGFPALRTAARPVGPGWYSVRPLAVVLMLVCLGIGRFP